MKSSPEVWTRIQHELNQRLNKRLVLDGVPGPKTAAAIARELDLGMPTFRSPRSWPTETKSQDELFEFYGQPGQSQVRLELPYTMVLDWNPTKALESFFCHEKCHKAFKAVFTGALKHYRLKGIQELRLDRFGGCLNVRKKRGGLTWSLHAWGAAIDLAPTWNPFRSHHDSVPPPIFSKPEYDKFWEIVGNEGLTSLGREKDFDWMHIQAANLP